MRAGLLLLLFGAGLSAQQAGVSGITVDKSTGQPLRGVHVRFITGDFGSQGGVDVVYGAFSDATGHFAVEGMKPGLYFVMAERAGFLQLAGEGLPISTLGLKAGQR